MRGIPVAELAQRAGVTRQTIYAIEDGSFVPNTAVALRLARALEVAVEEIFSIPDEQPPELVSATLLPGESVNSGELVRLCPLNDSYVAAPISFLPAFLPQADGVVDSCTHRKLKITALPGTPEPGKRIVLAGCDPALSLLQDALQTSGMDVIPVACSSRRALDWLKEGRIHVAGSHLRDAASGDYNVPIVRRLLPGDSVRVVTFAAWEQGFVIANGNPKRIKSVADLTRKNVKIINREKGAGSRDLLDGELKRAGIKPERVRGYDSVAPGHLAAAYAVAARTADCCVAPRSAARRFGLSFIPLAEERFDLSFWKSTLDLPATRALLNALNSSVFRKKLQSIAGYESTHTGDVAL